MHRVIQNVGFNSESCGNHLAVWVKLLADIHGELVRGELNEREKDVYNYYSHIVIG